MTSNNAVTEAPAASSEETHEAREVRRLGRPLFKTGAASGTMIGWARISAAASNATPSNPATVLEVLSLDSTLVPGQNIFTSDLFFVETGGATVEPLYTYDGTNFNPPVTAAPALATMQAQLTAAGTSVCQNVLDQVTGNSVHLSAYQLAAAWVAANGGSAPTGDGSVAQAFNAQASSLGLTPAQLASTAVGVSAASMTLSATLTSLTSQVSAASDASDLKSALDAFETSVGDLVSSLNGSGELTITVVAPAAIAITGINA